MVVHRWFYGKLGLMTRGFDILGLMDIGPQVTSTNQGFELLQGEAVLRVMPMPQIKMAIL